MLNTLKMQNDPILESKLRDLIMAVASGIIYVPSSSMMDKIESSPEPIERKVEALKKAEDIYKDGKFSKVADELIKTYIPKPDSVKNKSIPKEKPINKTPTDNPPVNKNPEIQPDVNIKELYDFISPYEIYEDGKFNGKDKEKDLLKPYKCENGFYTIGVGHKIGDGSARAAKEFMKKYGESITIPQARELFDKDVVEHYNKAYRKFKDQWDTFSPDMKKALIDISFRGDLIKKDSPDEHKFVQHIRNRDFLSASKEYIDHAEYKKKMTEYKNKSPKDKAKDGVGSLVKRFDRNSKIMAKEAELWKKK